LFVASGIGLWATPETACQNLAGSRGLVASAVQCPSYTGAHAVFEMYSFSLGKHFWMIGLVFGYFALRGRRDAVAAGLIYVPVALAIDCLPPLSWFAEAGVVGPASWAPIYTLTAVSAAMGAVGLIANARGDDAVPARV
jgi:hypothetical protein